jgi:hypothetical protein
MFAHTVSVAFEGYVIVNKFWKYSLMFALIWVMQACGGGDSGGGGENGSTCSDFKYQEDAQDHYQPQLDADNDGIACESLPRRP